MMKYLFLLISPLLTLLANETDFIDLYLDQKIDFVRPEEFPYGTEYWIFAAQEDTPAQLLQLLEDTDYKSDWPRIISALSSLSVGYEVPVEPMLKATEDFENSTDLVGREKLEYIERAYSALAREGSEASLDFLKKRTRKEFWDGREMPSYTVKVTHSDAPAQTVTARSEAITAISLHPHEAAELYLEELNKDPEFYEDPILARRLGVALRMRGTWMRAHEKRVRAFELKHELSGESPTSEISEHAIPGISSVSPVQEIAITVEGVTPPEAAIEGSAEVVVAEPIEEDVEQSSNWWLWLIGVLVFVGGVLLFVRKSNGSSE